MKLTVTGTCSNELYWLNNELFFEFGKERYGYAKNNTLNLRQEISEALNKSGDERIKALAKARANAGVFHPGFNPPRTKIIYEYNNQAEIREFNAPAPPRPTPTPDSPGYAGPSRDYPGNNPAAKPTYADVVRSKANPTNPTAGTPFQRPSSGGNVDPTPPSATSFPPSGPRADTFTNSIPAETVATSNTVADPMRPSAGSYNPAGTLSYADMLRSNTKTSPTNPTSGTSFRRPSSNVPSYPTAASRTYAPNGWNTGTYANPNASFKPSNPTAASPTYAPQRWKPRTNVNSNASFNPSAASRTYATAGQNTPTYGFPSGSYNRNPAGWTRGY